MALQALVIIGQVVAAVLVVYSQVLHLLLAQQQLTRLLSALAVLPQQTLLWAVKGETQSLAQLPALVVAGAGMGRTLALGVRVAMVALAVALDSHLAALKHLVQGLTGRDLTAQTQALMVLAQVAALVVPQAVCRRVLGWLTLFLGLRLLTQLVALQAPPHLLEQLTLVMVVMEMQAEAQQPAMEAAQVLLFFQFLLQVTQAQPQVHQQLRPAVLIQF